MFKITLQSWPVFLPLELVAWKLPASSFLFLASLFPSPPPSLSLVVPFLAVFVVSELPFLTALFPFVTVSLRPAFT